MNSLANSLLFLTEHIKCLYNEGFRYSMKYVNGVKMGQIPLILFKSEYIHTHHLLFASLCFLIILDKKSLLRMHQ